MSIKNSILLLSVCLMCAGQSLFAKEIPVGTIEVAADVDVSMITGDTTTSYPGTSEKVDLSYTNLSGAGGYYFTDNTAVNFTLGLSSTTAKAGTVERTSSTTAFGPGITHNISINEDFNFIAGLDVMMISTDEYMYGKQNSGSGIGYVLGLGAAHFLKDDLSLNYTLSISNQSVDYDISGVTVTEETNLTRLGIGISIYFQ